MALAVIVTEDDGHARPEKRPGAFRTISEVAEDLDVPQHVLRFWEGRFAQVRPVKRAGGRRYYRPEDVDLLKGIRRLLHGQGYTIRGAQQVLRQHGIRFVQEIGRGQAEADAPPPAETEAEDPPREPASASATDEAVLRAVLADLEACRAALRALRSAAEAETGAERGAPPPSSCPD